MLLPTPNPSPKGEGLIVVTLTSSYCNSFAIAYTESNQPSSPQDVSMAQDLNALFRFKDLRSYPLTGMHMIMGTRLCILFGQAGRDPTPDLAVRLRSMEAARRVARLVRSIQEAWPDAFLVHPPCCMTLSPDEALLGDLVVAATRGDEDSAVVLMRDVFPAETVRHLFLETVAAAAAIQSAQLQPHRPEA